MVSNSNLPELLDRVRDGDNEALLQVLQQCEGRLQLTARALIGPALRSRLDALDLVQSAHCRLMTGLRQGRYQLASIDRLLALGRTVMRNQVHRLWRRQAQERDVCCRGRPAREPADPARAVAGEDLCQQFLSRLREPDRQLLALRLKGYSTAEIGQELALDPHVLRARLARLRERLRSRRFGHEAASRTGLKACPEASGSP